MDDSVAETAGELGITKGDLLLMTRLVLFIEGRHDVIILSEWFGNELRTRESAFSRSMAETISRNWPSRNRGSSVARSSEPLV